MKTLNIFVGDLPLDKISLNANKRPEEQIKDLINFINNLDENRTEVLYTNSPYVINYLTLYQGYQKYDLQEFCEAKLKHNLRLFTVDGEKITECEYYKYMISDDNLLNNHSGISNDKYSDLLDLADKHKKTANNYDISI